jgi:hypothetical protein
MGVELLLPLVPITESLVVLPPISSSSTNIILVGLVEGFVEGRIDYRKVTEQCSFHVQVVLVHRGSVTKLGVHILKLVSITYLARTQYRALRDIYPLSDTVASRAVAFSAAETPTILFTHAEYALVREGTQIDRAEVTNYFLPLALPWRLWRL